VGQDRGQRSNHKALKGKQPDVKDVLAVELLRFLESPGLLDRFSFCIWSRETISQPPGQCDRSLLKGTVPAPFDKLSGHAFRSSPGPGDRFRGAKIIETVILVMRRISVRSKESG
jgi:hypothetical protein